MSKKAKATLALVLALALLALKMVGPQLATARVRLLQLGTTTTVSTAPAAAALFDAHAWESGQPLDPTCGYALSCFVDHPEVTSRTTIEARAGATSKEADYSAQHLLSTTDGRELFRAEDTVTLVRHSSFPVDKPLASLSADSPIPGLSHHITDQSRDGLQYSFPFATEFRSYHFFDVFSASTTPIDFHDKETMHGQKVYRFHQKLAPVQLESASVKGAANRFYSPEEIADQGLAAASTVVMNQFYSMTRTLWVEPKTGTIVDSVEIPHVFLARDLVEAQQVQPESPRTLFKATLRWDDATQQAMWERASSGLRALRLVAVGTLLATIASAALVLLAIAILRRQD